MYRLKHIPTGLYFIPVRTVMISKDPYDFAKSNLSKLGKVYHKKPSLSFLGGSYYNHIAAAKRPRQHSSIKRDVLCGVVESEWVIEEIALANTKEEE